MADVADRCRRVQPRWSSPVAYVLLAIFTATTIRFLFATHADLPFESDEAVVGLMARHILYQGERPIFYYGQSYLGPLEAATAALSFLVLGPTVTALRLTPLAYSLVFVWFTADVARHAFGELARRACLAYLALPPLFLLTWSVKARGGYAELLALGAAILWLTVDISQDPRSRPWRWPVLGVVAGLALWTNPLAVVYLGPATLYLLAHVRRRLLNWTTLAAVVALLLACLPMLLANVASGGETFRELVLQNTSTSRSLLDMRHNLGLVARESLPVLVGFVQASSDHPSFASAVQRAGTLAIIGLIASIAILLATAVGGLASMRHLAHGKPRPTDLLMWVAVATIILFVASRSQAIFTTEPRYLLPLYALVPVGAAAWSRVWRWRPAVAILLLGAALLLNASSVTRFDPALAAPVLDGQIVRSDDPDLVAYLRSRGIAGIYADYWIGYPISFLSGESVPASVIDDRLAIGFNRYVPYAIAVDQTDASAVVVVTGSPAEERLTGLLQAQGRGFRVGRWHDLDVYDRIVPPYRPGRV